MAMASAGECLQALSGESSRRKGSMAGDRAVAVVRVRITGVGRNALAAEDR
jgi:hypothetical protein